jgi:hypothetical protein
MHHKNAKCARHSETLVYYSRFKTELKLENYLLGLNAVHRNYICKVRTSNIIFQIETKNILWNEYLCST